MTLFCELVILAASGIAFLWGCVRIVRHKGVALYFQLIVAAVGCLMLGELYEMIIVAIKGALPDAFHIGYLGDLGCFLFLFSANYGQMDGLIDEGTRELRKYRAMSLIAPVAMLMMAIVAVGSAELISFKIVIAVVVIPLLAASYFNLKHLVFPDFGFGFLKAVRPCNMIALMLEAAYLGQLIAAGMGLPVAELVVSVAMAALVLCLVFWAERGIKQWII